MSKCYKCGCASRAGLCDDCHKELDTDLTRCEILCYMHGYQGGTIHQYNRAYKVDFNTMHDYEFKLWCQTLSYRSNQVKID